MGEAAGDRVLSRLHSVRERIGDSLSAHPNELVAVFTRSALIFPSSQQINYIVHSCERTNLYFFCYSIIILNVFFLR
jgi:hypothetical protein